MAIKVNNNTVITDSRGLQDINNNLGNSVQVVGSNGTSFVWRNASEFLGVQGTQGIQGRQGIQGTAIQGIQGSNAIIQGIQGTQGLQGRQGPQGIRGTDGTQGLTGVQGITGTQIGSGTNLQINSLGVGTPASGTAGEIRATNNITAYYSDLRLKENIKQIENALAKLLSIQGVTYTANEVAAKYGYVDKSEQVGVLAQELEKVLPHVVTAAPFDIAVGQDGVEYSRSGENYKTVRYERIIPLLIEAIKEQQEQINIIIEDVNMLKNNYPNK